MHNPTRAGRLFPVMLFAVHDPQRSFRTSATVSSHLRRCLLVAIGAFALLISSVSAQVDASTASSAAAKIKRLEDVIYGRVLGAALLADIAYPELKTPAPAIISVHGGRWKAGH